MCESYLILRDSFPQWLIDQNIIKPNSIVEKYFRYFEMVNYKSANHIGLMSEKNHELFCKKYPNISNTQVLYNWTDFKNDSNISKSTLTQRLSLNGKVIFSTVGILVTLKIWLI